MIENCLRHKIIRDFLKHYTENRWKDLIPSLIEIGILNLQKSFNKLFFTSEELKNVLRHLQISQIEKDKEKNKEKDNKDINLEHERKILTQNNSREKGNEKGEKNKLYKSLSKPIEKEKSKSNINEGQNGNNNVLNINNNNIQRMKIVESSSCYNNLDKQDKIKYSVEAINEMKNNIKNNYHYFKNNISIDFKKKINRQKVEYYKKIDNKCKNIQKKHIDKISYAISYDKDLRPASISRKINRTHNKTNNINIKTENDMLKYSHNYSSEKKSKNDSKSKNNNKYHKSKEKLLNLNLNDLNQINYLQNLRRKQNNFVKPNNNKLDLTNIGRIEKNNNFYKKVHMLQKNIRLGEMNHNYQVVKIDKHQMNKIKPKQYLNNNNISSSYNNYRNINFISTLYQKVNNNEQAIKINNDNYFSNREELNDFIRKNRIKLNIKNDYRKKLTKSERPLDRKNNFLNMDEKDKDNEDNENDNFLKDDEKIIDKNNSVKKIFIDKERDKEIKNENENELINSYPNNNSEYMKLTKSKTPNKNKTNSEKDSISISKTKKENDDSNKKDELNNNNNNNNDNEINDKNIIENKNNNDINIGLKPIKVFDYNKGNNKNGRNNNFDKANGKCANRYFNVFGSDGEDISLTQMDKEGSDIIDSSTSNDIRMTQDFIFKETPINVFKINNSNEQSINSYHYNNVNNENNDNNNNNES